MIGMEELDFEFKYDCVWIQWVIGHLTDEDLVNFLKKCKVNLNPGVRRNHTTHLKWSIQLFLFNLTFIMFEQKKHFAELLPWF